jgi:lipopolysaccharide export system protein LptA
MKYKFSVFLFTFILIFSSYAKEKSSPIVIEADELTFNSKENIAVYKGHAKVKKDDLLLKADRIEVKLTKKGDINRLVAYGHVYFKKGTTWGKAKSSQLLKDRDMIVLKGNAELHQGNTMVEGEEIIFYIKEQRVVVRGKGKKVKTIILPK